MIIAGKTRLRIVEKHHKVVDALPMSSLHLFLSQLGTWWYLAFVVAVMTAFHLLSAYIDNPFVDELVSQLPEIAYTLIAALIYGGVWVLIARAQHHEGRLLLHTNLLLTALTLTIP